tara:strand:- start:1435 stop:2289 length:855 start_codon:yes stop_codon:yes gene_type:complete
MVLKVAKGYDASVEYLQQQWRPLYAAHDRILGNTYTQVPIGDPHYGSAGLPTFLGRRKHTSGLAPTWTPSERLDNFDTPLDLTDSKSYKGVVPILTLNGTDERIHTPDVGYWTRDDGAAAEKLSIAAWFNLELSGADKVLLSKSDAGSNEEWFFFFNSSEEVRFDLKDDSAGVVARRMSDQVVQAGVWHHVAVTYDGTGGSTAANGITMYLDGFLLPSTATNDGSYVAMEDLGSKVDIGALDDGSLWYPGSIAGGPLGPIFEQVEWGSGIPRQLYEIGKKALAL